MKIPEELYLQICRVMPIACVDLLVADQDGRILLVKRKNEPAAGQWWFPGGRVHLNETRADAAVRKLREECNLEAVGTIECGTYDLIFPDCQEVVASHGITTLFLMHITSSIVRIDSQSEDWQWLLPHEWRDIPLHPFVRQSMELANGLLDAAAKGNPRC
jgi:ADP-ribose pyrophosphatase YjhB (NUDIX family)